MGRRMVTWGTLVIGRSAEIEEGGREEKLRLLDSC